MTACLQWSGLLNLLFSYWIRIEPRGKFSVFVVNVAPCLRIYLQLLQHNSLPDKATQYKLAYLNYSFRHAPVILLYCILENNFRIKRKTLQPGTERYGKWKCHKICRRQNYANWWSSLSCSLDVLGDLSDEETCLLLHVPAGKSLNFKINLQYNLFLTSEDHQESIQHVSVQVHSGFCSFVSENQDNNINYLDDDSLSHNLTPVLNFSKNSYFFFIFMSTWPLTCAWTPFSWRRTTSVVFPLVPPGKRYRSVSAGSSRMLNGFFLQAFRRITGLAPFHCHPPPHTPDTHVHSHTWPLMTWHQLRN